MKQHIKHCVKHFSLLLLLLGAACPCTDKAKSQAHAEGLYLSAYEAIDSHHTAKAREHIEALAKLHPKDKRLPTLWALLAIVELRFEEALSLLEVALQSQPERADLWRHKGELLQNKKQCDKAKEAFEKALSLQPRDMETRQSLAECLVALGEVEAALTQWKKAAQEALPTQQAKAVWRAVDAMNAHGQAPQVRPWLESLVPPTEEPSLLWELIAHAHIQDGAFLRAVKAFEEAVKTNPRELHYWEALSALYEREQDMSNAQKALERGLETVPPNDKAALHLLWAQLCKRMHASACLQAQTQKALEHIDESSTQRLRALAALLVDAEREAEAFHIYWTLAEEPSGKEDASLQKQTAQLAHKLGKTHEAAQACLRLQALEPQTACP